MEDYIYKLSKSFIANISIFIRHRYYYIFAGLGSSGAQYGSSTERLEVDFTATSKNGYLEYGFLLNSSTSGSVMIGVSVGTGGTILML